MQPRDGGHGGEGGAGGEPQQAPCPTAVGQATRGGQSCLSVQILLPHRER